MRLRLKIFVVFLCLFLAGMAHAGSQQTSSVTPTTIIHNARYYLNEITPSFWTDAELLVWVNQGSSDIASRTRSLEATESISLSALVVEYPITSNYIDISTVIYNSADNVVKGLVRKNPQSIGNIPDPGEPVYWYEWNGSIGIFPAHSSLSGTATPSVTAYYVSYPSSVTTGQAVYTPAVYDRALTMFVVAQAFLKSGQFAKSGRFIAEYYAELDRFRSDLVDRPQEPEENIKRFR